MLRQRGDTIIEVIFATAALSLIIVVSLAIMNRGIATAQDAVEKTFVRQEIDGQAEAMRYLRDFYGAQDGPDKWDDFKDAVRSSNTPPTRFGECGDSLRPKTFYNYNKANPGIETFNNLPAETFATPGRGMWIEAVEGGSIDYGFIDFHIRACWEPPFSGPQNTLGTVVRLYYGE